MIVVRLMGGLGNQMFQYAAGRALAHRHGSCLKLDISLLQERRRGFTPRDYALCHFDLQASIATPAEIRKMTRLTGVAPADRIINFARKRSLLPKSPQVVTETSPGAAWAGLPDNVYLDGYWQSENYFKNIEACIRKELTVREELSGSDRAVAQEMSRTEAVSLHVRRGDYVSDPAIRKVYDVCDLSYYERAIATVTERVAAPRFFIFSDDPAWVRENLAVGHPVTFVDHNTPQTSYRDLRLMSLCRHHIVANSSFSWWGAWLNPEPSKVVVAPRTWASDGSIDSRSIVPQQWIVL